MKNSKPSIGTDNNGQIYCKNCGKAGFKTKSHAYGHTGVCRGIEGLKEALGSLGPSPSPSSSSPLGREGIPGLHSAIKNMIGNSNQAVAIAGIGAVANESLENYQRVQMAQMQDQIAGLKTITSNHVSHLSGQMGGISDFFESTKFKIALFIIAIGAVFYLLEKGDSKTKQKIGSDLLGYAMKKI